ncbi:hypothetical protein [Azospirillum sp. SYSU D00513]|uniref:hypothetical protein n=1 Tax=Azospirillum sp. SYSU D00513 TaxID=2812561 RepID=UPI001A974C15|nr:hypothetical protein [Azospirillum sp. SYSU D00513]
MKTARWAAALLLGLLLSGLIALGGLCAVSEFTSEGPNGNPVQTRISFTKGGVFLGGSITAASLPVFAAKLAVSAVLADGPVIVSLNSVGGNLEAALRMATSLRWAEQLAFVRTFVPNDATCQSACTVVFATGQDRIAGQSAVFMFHGVRWTGQNADHESAARLEYDLERRYFEALDAADPTLVEMLKARGVFDTVAPTFLSAEEVSALGPRFISWRAPSPPPSESTPPRADRR